MRSTMQDFPLTIGGLMKHGTTVHARLRGGDRDGRRHPQPDLRRARQAGAPGWPTACARWGSTATSGSAPSSGTTPSTSRPTSRSRRWVRCCTRSTSGCSPSSSSTSPTTPRTRSSSSTTRSSALLAPHLPEMKTVQHVLVAGPDAGDADLDSLRASGKEVLLYEDLLADQSDEFDWPERGRARRRGDVLHERHHRQPQGRRLQPPLGVAALADGHDAATSARISFHDRVLPIVPMFHANAWGLAYAALMSGAVAVHARPLAAGRAAVPVHEREQADALRRGADGVERRARLPRQGPGEEAGVAAADPVRRLRRTRRRCRRRSRSGTA